MLHLLNTREGMQRLDEVVGHGLLCAFDFDGTLAPIVEQPQEVRLPEFMRGHLLALQRHAPVAIITGRALADIAPRLGFTPDILIGNHGLEGVPGERAAADAEYHRAVCAAWRGQLDKLLAAEYPDPGVQIEDKRYSLSVHYRHAQAAARAEDDLAPLLATLDPAPRLVAGKCVFNLMPPGAGDKGSALARAMEEIGARGALYVGDDVTDEDVFRVRRADLLSVRVEPSETSAAPYFLQHIGEMPRLLQALAGPLAARGARNWLARDGLRPRADLSRREPT
jgi:trehalose 6-phosphate phosphatase